MPLLLASLHPAPAVPDGVWLATRLVSCRRLAEDLLSKARLSRLPHHIPWTSSEVVEHCSFGLRCPSLLWQGAITRVGATPVTLHLLLSC